MWTAAHGQILTLDNLVFVFILENFISECILVRV